MQIFEYPYVIITIFLLCFIGLAAVGIHFAVRGVKTAEGEDEKDFTNISALEKKFKDGAKRREDRCIIYIGLALDSFKNLYSANEAQNIYSEIKPLLLDLFTADGAGAVSLCSDNSFVGIASWNSETARNKVEHSVAEINKVLLSHSALNIADVRAGSYFAMGTLISFDEAMTRAKQASMLAKDENVAYVEWNVTSGKALEKKIKIENNIEKEIDNNRFFLEYQPVLDAKTKKIIGAEVLSRLNSETDGVISPGNFLSAVSSVGLSDKFDYYIFEKNCKWISNDKTQRECYKYTINFSRTTLSEPGFPEKIISIAEKYGLNHSCLAVEILEDKNLTGEAKRQIIDNLSVLKEKGFSVLLDDFGSGYTTFSDLQNLDISIVKIDKAITQNATTETGFIILKNIITTSKDIGFKTLCEGIETKEQEEAVIKAGCDLLQGFYYYKPMSVTLLERLFEKNTEV